MRTTPPSHSSPLFPSSQLLSSESDDIDISLSTMTGHSFALSLQSYLSSSFFTSSDLASDPMFQSSSTASNSTSEIQESSTEVKGETKVGNTMSKIGKIEANPEQSKSLETATATLFGLSLDFVNLRKEIYQDGSRIPVMVGLSLPFGFPFILWLLFSIDTHLSPLPSSSHSAPLQKMQNEEI